MDLKNNLNNTVLIKKHLFERNSAMYTILILEDDLSLNETISNALQIEGYRVQGADNCQAGKELAANNTFDLAILDVNLPDGDGFQFCRWLKARCSIPVLFLSAMDLEDDMLEGYESGAVDYITKPFSLKILLKKIHLILEQKSENTNIYDDGFLKIDFNLGTVQILKRDCSLTPTEYKILKKLIERKGQLMTYSVLLDALWSEGVQFMDRHALAVNINRLRKKIEIDGHSYISNVYGMGYLWK